MVSRWCPFRWRAPKRRFTFGVAGSFIDYLEEGDRIAEEYYNTTYTTCWKRFVRFLRS